MDFEFSEEQVAIRDTIRELVQDKVAPRAAEIDAKSEYPQDIEKLFASNGILGIPFPEQYGGISGSSVTICMGIEEIAKACATSSLILAVQALGIAQAAVDESRALLAEREPAQGDEFMLADMATRLESARLLAYHAAWLCSNGRQFTRQASMAKLHCTDTAMQVALDGLQLAGDEGTFAGSPFERHVRDAKALQIYEGSNQVQRIVIARDLLR